MWEEEFIVELGTTESVVVDVYDFNRVTKDDFLGTVSIAAAQIASQRISHETLSLRTRPNPNGHCPRVIGTITVSYSWIDSSSAGAGASGTQTMNCLLFDSALAHL